MKILVALAASYIGILLSKQKDLSESELDDLANAVKIWAKENRLSIAQLVMLGENSSSNLFTQGTSTYDRKLVKLASTIARKGENVLKQESAHSFTWQNKVAHNAALAIGNYAIVRKALNFGRAWKL